MQLSTDLVSRSARFTFAALMALAWCGMPRNALAAPAAAGENAANLAQLADRVEKVARIYAAVDRDLPRDTFDPAFVVAKVGKDPGELLAWVRQKTAYVPYRGALRGAVGVLMDRNGNSLDRSLLLGRLLQLAGHRVRLAHGQLSQAQAETLLKTAWEDAKSTASQPATQPAADDATIASLASDYSIDPALVRRGLQEQQLRRDKELEDLVGTVVEQSDALTSLVGGPTADPTDRAKHLAQVADHWWVQCLEGGKWIDRDPAAEVGKSGEPLVAASQTLALPDDGALSTTPLPLHEVELRVVTERTDSGASSSAVVFRHTLRPAELAGQTARLQIMPTEWPTDLDLTTGDPTPKLQASLLAQEKWVPVLTAAGQQIVQGAFDRHGIVDPKPKLDALGKMGSRLAGNAHDVGSVLDAPQPASPSTGELTAVWLEFEIRAPGEPNQLVRRDLFDAFGPARRASGKPEGPAFDDAMRLSRSAALYRQITLLPIGCVPSPEFVAHVMMSNVIARAPVVARTLRQSGQKSLKQSLDDLGPMQPTLDPVLYLSAARRASSTAGADFAVDRLNLFAMHGAFAVDAGGLVFRAVSDIVANHVAVRGLANDDGFKARIAQGVLETALERRAIGRVEGGVNTVTLFSASQAQHVNWIKLASADDPKLSNLKLAPDSLERIRTDLKAGYVVVAPASPVASGGQPREGWWRIDPRDGTCIGFAANGMGAELAEYALVLVSILIEAGFAFHCLQEGGGLGCIVCFIIFAGADYVSLFGGFSLRAAVGISVGAFLGGQACEHFAA